MRVFANQDGSNMEGDLEFYPFSKDFALREIILGARCSMSISQFSAAVPGIDPSVKLIQARRSVQCFYLEPSQD